MSPVFVFFDRQPVRDDRHWIVAAGVPWMAPAYPLYPKPPAPEHAVSVDCFIGVMGTGRGEPAARRKGRGYELLIEFYQPQNDGLHFRTSFGLLLRSMPACERSETTSLSTWWKSAPMIGCLAMRIKSHPGSICSKCSRTLSRINLLARLRLVAFPTLLLAVKPALEKSRPFGSVTSTQYFPM